MTTTEKLERLLTETIWENTNGVRWRRGEAGDLHFCSWCSKGREAEAFPELPQGNLSHGICTDCARQLLN